MSRHVVAWVYVNSVKAGVVLLAVSGVLAFVGIVTGYWLRWSR